MSVTARDFYQGLRQSMYNLLDTVRPWRATIASIDGATGMVTVTPDVSDVELEEPMAVLTPWDLDIGDDVMVLPFGGSWVVVDRIRSTLTTTEELNSNLIINGDFTAQDIIGNSFNSPIVHTEAQSSSDTTSTTNTATYVDAMLDTINLGTGQWTIHTLGGVELIHSAGSTSNMRISIDGNDGTARSLSVNSSVYTHCVSEHIVGNVDGSFTLRVQYKSSTAGTTSARNPWAITVCTRTA